MPVTGLKNHSYQKLWCNSENLIESELYGYEEGFTGAKSKGNQGNLNLLMVEPFLDEIGDMPLHMQVKL